MAAAGAIFVVVAIRPFLDASGNKNIGATIRIGRGIWCLPYAGFLKQMISKSIFLISFNDWALFD